MIKCVVFLGNPGKAYEKTRHNAGFLLCDYLFPSVSWSQKFHSFYAKEQDLILLKPQTFMNISGTAVSEALSFFKFKPEEIAVAYDDLELPLGTIRCLYGGGLQGHNGLRSIKERIGSAEFFRIRIGIGRPKHGDVALYVTTPFSEDEKIQLDQTFTKVKGINELLKKDTLIKQS